MSILVLYIYILSELQFINCYIKKWSNLYYINELQNHVKKKK